MAAYLLRKWQLGLVGFLTISGVFTSGADRILAQITPDATLGAEGSIVTPGVDVGGQAADRIDSGATRGINLFHSFDQFNVGEGQRVYFANPTGIENILTRVTGTNASNILGTLGVTGGNANLFLINPNGIIFGSNARLDVGGSFTATTANAVGLGETGLFSASEPATSNLLTVRPSVLFFNAVAVQEIVNQSRAPSLSGQTNSLGGPVGLQVQTGKTLGLIGGNLAIEEGNLTAAEGRIELGSIAGVGEVSLSQIGNRWLFGYDNINLFGNIRLEGGAVVDASGEGGGDVQIQGAQLEMTQDSLIAANTLGSGNGGEILVRTTETVALRDESEITADVLDSGTGGDLTIVTGRLLVRDGAQVSAATFSPGDAGRLDVSALDSVEVIGKSADGRTPSGLFTQTLGEGNAGDLTIATGRLLVRDGAQVSAATSSPGDAGRLDVSASDTVELIGTSADGRTSSGFFTRTLGEGNAGDLTIDTRLLLVRDEAQVNVSSLGAGNAGNLLVEAGSISLDSGGKLQAESAFGKGGNIQLQVTGLLLLRDNSLISAVSGNDGSNGIDGNIDIDTKFLVAVPKENSDIVATGYGRSVGSNIQVNAQGIFGTQFREQRTLQSDIVATGTVELNTPDVDPNQTLTNLPTEVVDASNQIDQTCAAGGVAARRRSRFVITGSGGFPDSPDETLSPDAVWADLRFAENSKPPVSRQTVPFEASSASNNQPTTNNRQPTIVEAKGWAFNQKGEVVLTALEPTVTPPSSWQKPVACPYS